MKIQLCLFVAIKRAQGLLILRRSQVPKQVLGSHCRRMQHLYPMYHMVIVHQLFSSILSTHQFSLLQDQRRLNTSSFCKWSLQNYKSISNRPIGGKCIENRAQYARPIYLRHGSVMGLCIEWKLFCRTR